MKELLELLFENKTHQQVADLLLQRWNIAVSDRTIREKCRAWGLGSKTEDVDPELLLGLIQMIATESSHVLGYRSVYNIIRSRYGVRVSQHAVRLAMATAFPDKAESRGKSSLKRREYNGYVCVSESV